MLDKHPISLAELMELVATGLQIESEALPAPSKERNIARAKAIISCLAVRKLGIS